MSTPKPTPKQEARRLLDDLPEDATWDDVVYELVVRRSIARGVADAEAGRVTDIKDVRKDFDVPE
jgi:predicted transcriptional regulator